jgi:hypothetical protein
MTFAFTAGCGTPTVFPLIGGTGISGGLGAAGVTVLAAGFGKLSTGCATTSTVCGTGMALRQRGQRTMCPDHSSGTPIFWSHSLQRNFSMN